MSDPIASFGCMQSPEARHALEQKYTRVSQCVQMCEVVTAISTIALAILATCCLIAPGVGVGIFVGLGLITLALSTYQDYLFLERFYQQAGTTPLAFEPTPATCHAITTQDYSDTIEWRNRCIAVAEESIIISGNYCGGEVFLNVLEAIEKRILEKTALKVVILSSPLFLKGESKSKLNTLLETYPQNLSLVKCPLIWHIASRITLTTNHTKCMVIDQGRYFILGGSCLTDQFHLKGKFRDQDWVFSDETGAVGRQLYQQMLFLAHRWEFLNQAAQPRVFSDEPGSNWPGLRTEPIPELESHPHLARESECRLLISGPEQSDSPFAKEVFTQINEAQTSILIDHMYFHPTDKIMNALADAANRGVRIEIITCGLHSQAPASHSLFAPRNRANYTWLMHQITEDNRKNLSVYEFHEPRKGLHKKLIVIDQRIVIAGSSNLGTKSLITSSDHEVNFVATSETLAQETLKVVAIDRNNSRSVEPPNHVEWSLRAPLHRWLGFLIG